MHVIFENKKEPDYTGTQILYQHFFKGKQVLQNACRKMNMGCSFKYQVHEDECLMTAC